MIISLTLGIVIAVIVAIAITAGIYFILKSLKAGQKAGIITGLIIGSIAGVAVVMMAGRIVVVHSPDEAGEYLVYGSPEYEFSNGFKMNLDMASGTGYILNDSEDHLVMEKVIYSTSGFFDEYYDVHILPMSITEMQSFKIDYYFDDIPPDEIEVQGGSSSVTKYWLRTKESYENDYGASYYDPDVKSIHVGSSNTANDSEEE